MSWALAVLGGGLAWLGFASADAWPLALIAFVPLFAALERDPGTGGGRAWLLGGLCGTVAWAGACAWVPGTLRAFSELPWLACAAIAALFWIYHGGLFAAFAWLWWRARRRGASALLAGTAAFTASELLYPQLFPSRYGASLHGVPILLQIADLGGPLLISALCIAVNAALYELWADRGGPAARRACAGAAACVLATLVYGGVRMAQVDRAVRAAPHLRVGIVQPDMEGRAKWSDRREGQRRLAEGTRQLEESVHPDLILWPENAHAATLPAGAERLGPSITGGARTPLLLGSMARAGVDGSADTRNRILLVDRDGRIEGRYDKVHLLPFGEYLPFEHSLPWLRALSPRSGRLQPGTRVDPLRYGAWRISALVCYEDMLPGFVRRVVLEGSPHLLVNFTNDAWFGASRAAWLHLELAELRAIENRRYLVRATNTGVSAVIDPAGRLQVRSGLQTRETLHADVALLQGRTPYQVLGDWPGWLAAGATVWLAFLRRTG